MLRAFFYPKILRRIHIANKGKKEVPMNSQGLVECPDCGHLWHLNADDQYGLVLFEKITGICPKCDMDMSILSQKTKIKRERSGGIHATKV
jgi:ssDNA-binding Zn-finger/Zn-ribbon topoisomerase 1